MSTRPPYVSRALGISGPRVGPGPTGSDTTRRASLAAPVICAGAAANAIAELPRVIPHGVGRARSPSYPSGGDPDSVPGQRPAVDWRGRLLVAGRLCGPIQG